MQDTRQRLATFDMHRRSGGRNLVARRHKKLHDDADYREVEGLAMRRLFRS